MSNYLIIFLFCFIIVYGAYHKVKVYDAFLEGAKSGLTSTINMFESLLSFSVAISLLLSSGIIEFFQNKMSFSYSLIVLQSFIRPFSSSASLSIMLELYGKYGADDLKSIISTMIHYISDASFYIIPFYFGMNKIKNNDRLILLGFLINMISYVIVIIIIHFFINSIH